MDLALRVLVTRKIPEIGLKILQKHFEVDANPESESLTASALRQRLAPVDAVLCLLTDRIDPAAIDAAPNLKVISNHAVGYDNIDVPYATRKNIAVCNTPGVLTEATADFAWALLMSITRRIPEGEKLMRSGEFHGWDPLMLLGADLQGKTLGIIGAGRIGSAMAHRSAGWQMKVLYHSRSTNTQLEKSLNARRVALEELLQTADFISIHLPLTAETRHLINKETLQMMKPGAYLINTARGAIIDEAALVEALAKNTIAGAGLDVYEYEPKMVAGLKDLQNVILAPHIGSATIDTRNKMASIAAENIVRVLKGEPAISQVN